MKQIALEPEKADHYWDCNISMDFEEKAKYFRKVYFRLLYLKILTDWGYLDHDFFDIMQSQRGKEYNDLILQDLFEDSKRISDFSQHLTDSARQTLTTAKIFTRPIAICAFSEEKKGKKQIMNHYAYTKIIENIFRINLRIKDDDLEGDSETQKVDFDTLGYIFEETLNISGDTRKKTGTYYTPKWVTEWLTAKTITGYILSKINENIRKYNEKINEMHKKIAIINEHSGLDDINLTNVSENSLVAEWIFQILIKIRICDNACGAGAFLEPIADFLLKFFRKLGSKELKLPQNEKKSMKDPFEPELFILNNLIFGVDINDQAIELSRIRLFLWFLRKTKIQLQNYKRDANSEKNITKQNHKSYQYSESLVDSISKIKFNLYIGNTLSPDRFPPELKEDFDIIIGNPPYGNLLSAAEKNAFHQIYPFSAPNEISSYFIERSIHNLKSGGYLTYIVTYAITFHTELSNIRKMIKDSFENTKIITFDRDKCKIFSSMTQSVSVLECCVKMCNSINNNQNSINNNQNSINKNQNSINKNQNSINNNQNSINNNQNYINNQNILRNNHHVGIYSSEMFRTIPKSLDSILLENIEGYLFLTKNFKLGKDWNQEHRLPKLGTHKPILDKLSKCNNILGDLLLKNGGEQMWYRNTGNYWYNAWTWKPYSSSDIHSLHVKDGFMNFVLLIINSQIFYVWNRIYGDGRHLNNDLLKGFPIPDIDTIRNIENEICRWKDILMKELKRVYDEKRNRFLTSQIKKTLDSIDVFLASLYGFEMHEIEYILNYEREIHGGSQIELE